jgi:hypothetical protein
MLFGDPGFSVGRGCGTYLVGTYNSDAIKAGHVDKGGNEGATSSMKVPDGLTIRAWRGEVFDGDEFTIAGPA